MLEQNFILNLMNLLATVIRPSQNKPKQTNVTYIILYAIATRSLL